MLYDVCVFFFKQKTAYEMRISDWSSDVCSSDLGRYLSDELTLHYGLVPRTNRGIFAINELPDLAERIQVGLLNVLEERDIQVRGYKINLPVDIVLFASANPADYTNRGRIITPLKDRFGSHARQSVVLGERGPGRLD